MLATIEQARTEQLTSTTPIVVYDPASQTITLNVIVSLPSGASDVNIAAAPVTIPAGTWTLFWDLVVDTPGLQATFANPGIILPSSLPPKVTVVAAPSGNGLQWTAQLANAVLDVNAFSYDIGVTWSLGTILDTGVPAVFRHTTVHDPTIAVTKDPMT